MRDHQNHPETRMRNPAEDHSEFEAAGSEGLGVDVHQKAVLETLVTLEVGPEAHEEARARVRQRILEGQRRIAETVLREVRLTQNTELSRHG